MFTQAFKQKVILVAASALLVVNAARADDEPLTNQKSAAEIAAALDHGRLNPSEISDLRSDGGGTAANPTHDLLGQIAGEGIPKAGDSADPQEVINNAYTSVALIEKALKERLDYPMGPRIAFMETQSHRIIHNSKSRIDEMLMRFTLNRGLDVTSFRLPIQGNNTDEVARVTAAFYKDSFELAAYFVNNNQGIPSCRLDLGKDVDVADYLKKLSMAEYGRMYSKLLWNYSSGLASGSSKAVILMRLLTYLGWDMNIDLRRRQAPIAETIADVYEQQQSPAYNNILCSIKNGQEPNTTDLAALRKGVYRILEALPERLAQLGK